MNQIGEGIITVFILSLITVGFFYAVIAHDNAELSTTTAIPEPYYTATRNPDLTSQDLITLLNNFSAPHEYERDTFDCTEGAAYMEWYLENRGYDAELAIVLTPFGSHAVTIVHLQDRDKVLIDTFVPSYLRLYTKRYNDEDTSGEGNGERPMIGKHTNVHKNIYDACEKGRYSEWDWWNEVNFTAVDS